MIYKERLTVTELNLMTLAGITSNCITAFLQTLICLPRLSYKEEKLLVICLIVSVTRASGFSRSWDIGAETCKLILKLSIGLLHFRAGKATAERNAIHYNGKLPNMKQPSGLCSSGWLFV